MTDELLPALPEYGIDTANHARVRVLGYTGAQMLDYAREAIRLALENGMPVEIRDDARRYRSLKPMLFAADFDYYTGVDRICALIFQIPDDARVSADLDSTIDEISPPAGEVA